MRSVHVVVAGVVLTGGCAPIVAKDADVVRVGAEEFSVIPIAHGTVAIGHEGPDVLYPYHYRGQEPTDLRYAVQGTAIDVRVLDWY